MEKNNKKTIKAWCMYDWANSVYNLTITTAVFPEYYLAVTSNPTNDNTVKFLGFELVNSVLYSYALSLSFLLVAIFSPFLTAIADYTGKKKMFMRIFCYMGSLSCAYLFFFTKENITISIIAFILAGWGWGGSIVFYNSFLPEITTEDKMDKVSARGFAYGYIGSVILLIFNLIMILNPELFGIDVSIPGNKALPARISFLSVGIWWFSFAHYSFYYLPSNVYKKEAQGNWLFNGFKELKKVSADLSWQPLLKSFILAFFLYNLGVQTVMLLATVFGKKEIGLETAQLIMVVLVIQLVAIVGANFFAWLSGKFGNIHGLAIAVVIWIGICIAAYFVKTGFQFYSLAVVVGFVMGGIQSLSRSTYSKLIPQDTTDHASYFSFFDATDKISIVLGTMMFGVIEAITGSMRNSTIALGIFFVLGLLMLLRIPSQKIYQVKKQI